MAISSQKSIKNVKDKYLQHPGDVGSDAKFGVARGAAIMSQRAALAARVELGNNERKDRPFTIVEAPAEAVERAAKAAEKAQKTKDTAKPKGDTKPKGTKGKPKSGTKSKSRANAAS